MRSAGKSFADHSVDLLHFLQQRSAGVQATGGVDDHDILATADTGVDGVEGNVRGIRAGVATDEIGAGSLSPRP